MFNFDTITEFIEILHKNRKIIDFMFKKRKRTVSYENLMAYADYRQEKIDFLIDENILLQSGNTIELNDELIDFFEKFSNATEDINNEYTDGLIADLRTRTEIFAEEKSPDKKDEYLLKIKSILRKIGNNILENINKIRANINDVYATEQN